MVLSLQSAVLTAWYGSRPEIRRLLAVRDTEGLYVLVELEPAPDSNEIHPAWVANRHGWTDELRGSTGAAVRLEQADESFFGGETSGDDVVADLSWRDPSSI